MKANTAIGIGFGIACLLLAVILEGGSPAALIGVPPFVIVVGGTAAATFASTTPEQMKRVPTLYRKAFSANDFDAHVAIGQMVGLADKARRDGLLALEDDLDAIDDEFTRKGLQLVVDGTDSEVVEAIMQSEIDGMAQRHKTNAHVFAVAGGFAPTLGIVGTVMSLVHVLENLSNPSSLGHSIAGAFIATLYGVGSANLVFLPVANKLKALSAQEYLYRHMQLEAILALQAGDNPRTLGEKLEAYLSPTERRSSVKKPAVAAGGALAGEAAAEAA